MSAKFEHTTTMRVVRPDAVELPTLEVAVVGSKPEVAVPLGFDPVLVGSGDDCTIVVADRQVSRRHCSITLTEEGIVLRDLGSKNKTFVGAMAVREAVIVLDVVIAVGTTALVVRKAGPPAVHAVSKRPQFGQAIGGSLVMRALFARLRQAAPTSETILLHGDSGTGKELLAKAVHDESARRDGPFVVFDCSAVSPTLFEAELFGHVRGAFTGANADRVGAFEQAHGGTLFLDEVGEVPLDVQPKLLRALEAKQVRPVGANGWRACDVRIVAASHRDLLAASGAGTFRTDLYYRLAVINARVPALRERGEDLELLAEHLLASQTPPRSLHDLAPNTLAMLRAHDFPGNVRELRNVLARLAIFPHLGPEAFDQFSGGGWERLYKLPLREARDQVVEEFESTYLTENMRAHAGNVLRLSQAAGVSRTMIYRLLERHGIKRSDD